MHCTIYMIRQTQYHKKYQQEFGCQYMWPLGNTRRNVCAQLHHPAAEPLGRDIGRGQLKCDGARAAKPDFIFRWNGRAHLNQRWCQFSRLLAAEVCASASIVGSNAGCTMFQGSVKCTGYPPHSPVSPSLPLPCVTVRHHISTGVCSLDGTQLSMIASCHAERRSPIWAWACNKKLAAQA